MKRSTRFLGTAFALSLLLGAQAQLLFDENSFDSVEEAPVADAGLGAVPGCDSPFGHGLGKRDFKLRPRQATTTTAAPTSTVTTTVCAPKYSVAQMITRTGTLPKPTTFVKRSTTGNQQGLTLNGAPFRIVGPNIYWLCQDENVLPIAAFTSKTRIREALAIAVAMGANTVRLISCGTSVGNHNYSIQPSLGVFAGRASAQWEIHDYAIYAAKQYGLRVILPLTDNYQYYHGGKYTFINWRNVSTANFGRAFYNNAQIVEDFKAYITEFLNHKNPYTKVINGREPAIMAWELGNEMAAYQGREGYPPGTWTKAIATLCKSLAPSQLVIAGDNGFLNPYTGAKSAALGVAAVDVMSDHGYPRSISLLNKQIPLATAAKKGFYIGEYDWTNLYGGDTLDAYFAAIEKTSYLGDMIWSLFGHDDSCCAFVQHDDGFSAYYPNGNSPALQVNLLKVVQHWYRMTGRAVPKVLPGVACPQPVF